jgi:hypothetical protein
MTDMWVWGLIASLILLAIGISLRAAHDAFLLKKTDGENTRLLTEIESLKKQHKESIFSIEQSNVAEKERLIEQIANLENKLKGQNSKPIKYPPSGVI